MERRTETAWRLVTNGALGVGLVALGLYCLFTPWSDPDFRRLLLANLGAVVAGILVAVPLALRLHHWQERDELGGLGRTRQEHVTTVLRLIRKELEHNGDLLLSAQGAPPEPTAPLLLKDTLWLALTRGGDLAWIPNPETLDRLASAYYYVGALTRLGPAAGGAPPSEDESRYRQELESKALGKVVAAVQAIDATLGIATETD